MILHWLLMKSIIFESFGLWWPFLAFIGLFGLCGLGWFFKAETGLCWWKLSTIDLFSTIRCQNQSPNEIRHFESVWLFHKELGVWLILKDSVHSGAAKNNFAAAKNAVHNAIVSSATAAKNRKLPMMVQGCRKWVGRRRNCPLRFWQNS